MKNSPIVGKHQALGAKMADFGGWMMPIEYPKTGAIEEYNCVRSSVGIFDVSHLGKISVIGKGATNFLNEQFTNDLNKIIDGQAQYTLMCNSKGGVIDDLIAYRNSDSDFFLIPNAANTASVYEVLKANAPADISVANLHEKYAVFALQGPKSVELLNSFGIDSSLDYMAFSRSKFDGIDAILCRTGYTGELGFEIIPTWQDAGKVWDLLLNSVLGLGGAACGLGARDLLRTEMGYPLHGHELTLDISPIQASASWAVDLTKSKFTGRQILLDQKQNGTSHKLKAILATDRAIPRKDMQIKDKSGKLIGQVTSGTFSPTLKKGIGLALISSEISKGDQVMVDVRGRDSVFEVVALPFVPSRVR
ncbi:MAG: glycine cleavage system aminomethyltransferase GcvT [Candidatus Nanopelagicus sp.]